MNDVEHSSHGRADDLGRAAIESSSRGTRTESKNSIGISAPSLALPKGGGAIRGMGEKFAANPVTGTGSLTVPIPVSLGRAGFGPQLSLNYDSGSGNGPFGTGWNLTLPSITRKTDKGLPKYDDAQDSDVFILSGAEDLVPVLVAEPGQDNPEPILWKRYREESPRIIDGVTYDVRRYRPRIEGLFARIERWTNTETGEMHWRSISKDNVTTIYGKTSESRIEENSNDSAGRRTFSWLICESFDDKGNVIVYRFKPENTDQIDRSKACEANRSESGLTNRYLKSIHYGNRVSRFSDDFRNDFSPEDFAADSTKWMFEVVFDYGEHSANLPSPSTAWLCRSDPFSTYRAGFEIRTYRLCQRVLIFHHFADEQDVGNNCLARSLNIAYRTDGLNDNTRTGQPIASFIASMAIQGFKRKATPATEYLIDSMPPLEFEYSHATIDELNVFELDRESLDNLPVGLGSGYQWVDLDGEGLSGILTEQANAWFYKRNTAANNLQKIDDSLRAVARFAAVELVRTKPNSSLAAGQSQFMDLAGDGHLDLVQLDGPVSGYFERRDDEWDWFRPFHCIPNVKTQDPNVKFVDLNGDGHADILIAEDEVFTWHPSLGKEGYGPGYRVFQPVDEEQGPRLVFADGTQTIFLADMSGDGLTDLARIKNGSVCYWPNLGYGQFGAKVTMDDSPWFDHPEAFDPKRIRLADIDGSGVTDIIYIRHDGIHLYFNQSGNSWAPVRRLNQFPHVDHLTDIQIADLLGNGTACLVWSSPLAADARRPLHYVDLMSGQKPHLLTRVINNLGAEMWIQYASSTKFYLNDKDAGQPWVTRLPFPVHVVEKVETIDRISRNRFVTRHAYHHGYFDGDEREFRGFGMVEQWDTDERDFRRPAGDELSPTNEATASYVPPIHTKTWFHNGAFSKQSKISRLFEHEYWNESDFRASQVGRDAEDARKMLLEDTVLPNEIRIGGDQRQAYSMTCGEMREACRALKGSVLRQEIYADDDTPQSGRPYRVSERNYTLEILQPQGDNPHAVYFVHPRESVNFHFERKLYELRNSDGSVKKQWFDPRVTHSAIFKVDDFGNVQESVAIAYGRRATLDELRDLAKAEQTSHVLRDSDYRQQQRTLVTLSQSHFTNPVVDPPEVYRAPLPSESKTFELVWKDGLFHPPGLITTFFTFDFIGVMVRQASDGDHNLPDDDIAHAHAKKPNETYRRLIEHAKTQYRSNDLTGLLEIHRLQSRAIPGESYRQAFTPKLLELTYQRATGASATPEPLLPSGAAGMANLFEREGGYLRDTEGSYWIRSGRSYFSTLDLARPDPEPADAQRELDEARQHFFMPRRIHDPFGNSSFVDYDQYDLLVAELRDALGNRIVAADQERQADGSVKSFKTLDYRVLQPQRIADANGNRVAVYFDTMGMVAGTAVMGKFDENFGDSLQGFGPELLSETESETARNEFFETPRVRAGEPSGLAVKRLGRATTRILYDLHRFAKTRQEHPNDPTRWEPNYAATIVRETHDSDLAGGAQTQVQVSFSYSDGFGREIQKKVQAEAGTLNLDDPTAPRVDPRWVGSGWTIYNNKGSPVKQFEPFFSATHKFEPDTQVGVSSTMFYDPANRVVATLHPNHTWEKVVFDPWQQETWDVNDTVTLRPHEDPDVGSFFLKLGQADGHTREYLPTWFERRTISANAEQFWPGDDPLTKRRRDDEKNAAIKAQQHAGTPSSAILDTLGRTVLTLAHNGFQSDQTPTLFATRIVFDIEGNQREVIDAQDRIVMTYDYDMLGNRIHQASMEAGERWMLNDVTGKPIRGWNSRQHRFRTEYDLLHRPLRTFVLGAHPQEPTREFLVERILYGEQHPDRDKWNLRGRPFQHFDQAGVATNELGYDFKGNPLSSSRQLAIEYKGPVDWKSVDAAIPTSGPLDLASVSVAISALVEKETFSGSTEFDALNRPKRVVAPHSDRPGTKFNTIRPTFNEANFLERVEVHLNGEETATVFVQNIDYDAKGQRTGIELGEIGDKPAAITNYTYDPFTFRLLRLTTTRQRRAHSDETVVQDLHYWYDPVGNISNIRDDAQQTVYFKNQIVEPHNEYTYDAISRLIGATGREHLGQSASSPTAPDAFNAFHMRQPQPSDGGAMGRFLETYEYDAVGNFERMKHRVSTPLLANPEWTRTFSYEEACQIPQVDAGGNSLSSNRLSKARVGGDPPNSTDFTERFRYDEHGNMISMGHLQRIDWDFRDQLQATAQQVRNEGTPQTTYYVYDSSGQRVRKITENTAAAHEVPSPKNERIYLGVFEVYREFQAGPDPVKLERETLHVMDEMQRVAIVETKTKAPADDTTPNRLIRYQFGNHLGSASLELDDQMQVVSYEEYTPYGTTSFQAVRAGLDGNPKRYRFTGKERDDETGLNYHGARYYAPWLGRWTSSDPISIAGGVNTTIYCRCNPVNAVDPNGSSDDEPPIAPPKPLVPEVGNHPEGLLAESQFNAEWEKAVEWQYGQGSLKANLESSRVLIEAAENPSEMGRSEYEAIYKRFRREIAKVPELAEFDWEGTQLHHINPITVGSAADPGAAVDPTGIVLAKGHALSPGTSHNRLHFGANTERGEAYAEATKGQPNGRPIPEPSVAEAKPPVASPSAPKPVAPRAPTSKPVAPRPSAIGKSVVTGLAKGADAGAFIVTLGVEGKDEGSSAEALLKMAVGAGVLKLGAQALRTPVGQVVASAAIGAGVGYIAEKELSVSDYSSAVGMKVDSSGGILGATVTVLATPSALGVAAVDKVVGGRIGRLLGIRK